MASHERVEHHLFAPQEKVRASPRGGDEGHAEGVCKYHTNATTGHVGSNHDRTLSSLELVENPIALGLLFVTVNSKARPAILTEELRKRFSEVF
jgi:hypothetical protein